ncbi:MAG: hypothetical protein H0T62_08335 [Parachlamydiaceae bacterium]|nr:hypothetical protein [Parachlamydiaceae bacterium]
MYRRYLGTAIDLAFDAAALYGEGGLTAACATAESTAISYNIFKTIGRVAGAAFSCAPVGKGAQVCMNVANVGVNVTKGAKIAIQVAKTATKVKNASTVGANGVKVANAAGNSQKLLTYQNSGMFDL